MVRKILASTRASLPPVVLWIRGALPSKWNVPRPAPARPSSGALSVTSILAAVSLFVAIREALAKGIDFQWSGARLIGQRLDPWAIMMAGDPNHLILPGQTPNYLHELYVLLLPLGRLPLPHALAIWCIGNLLMLAAALWITAQFFELDRRYTLFLALLTLCSTPFRVTLANGQHCIFVLFMLTIFFSHSAMTPRALALGLSYAKYSFSPVIVLFLLFRRRFKLLALSSLPPLAGLLVVWLYLKEPVLALALEPFKMSQAGVGLGWADVMSPLELVLRHAGCPALLCFRIPAAVGLFIAALSALLLARSKFKQQAEFALLILLTLLCFKHLLYDSVVLVIPLAFTLKAARSTARTVALLGIAYFWYGSTVINRMEREVHLFTLLVNTAVLLTIFVAVAKMATLDAVSQAAEQPSNVEIPVPPLSADRVA